MDKFDCDESWIMIDEDWREDSGKRKNLPPSDWLIAGTNNTYSFLIQYDILIPTFLPLPP